MTARRYLVFCKGPCAEPTPHDEIRPVSRGRMCLSCSGCGTVTSIAKSDLPT